MILYVGGLFLKMIIKKSAIILIIITTSNNDNYYFYIVNAVLNFKNVKIRYTRYLYIIFLNDKHIIIACIDNVLLKSSDFDI